MSEQTFLLSYIAAFVLALLPLVWGEVRHNRISNSGNALLLLVGCLSNAVGLWLGIYEYSSMAMWVSGAVAIALLVLFFTRIINGGTAKFLIALLPWLDIGEYILVWIAGMGLIGVFGLVTKRRSVSATPVIGILALGCLTFPYWSAFY